MVNRDNDGSFKIGLLFLLKLFKKSLGPWDRKVKRDDIEKAKNKDAMLKFVKEHFKIELLFFTHLNPPSLMGVVKSVLNYHL